ncbi:hypothetical protein Agub_g12894 [Astrephomene gubernaculifera]|uniref:NADP-dependent oxidoreductase domain-containing protein n=1 Tax=Astrephomene gubernaculifera TaxID=47775 RepID=A0AAD3HS62_9CHLO|nr:hypothetical protein Agub_g12894 [Astrephomene gubernaculifera]
MLGFQGPIALERSPMTGQMPIASTSSSTSCAKTALLYPRKVRGQSSSTRRVATAAATAPATPRLSRPLKMVNLGSSDLMVSEVCMGTMTFGEQNSEAESHTLLDMAAEHGVNFLDTSEIYPVAPRPETANRTSTYIGNWLRHRRREDFVVATKVAGRSDTLQWVVANRTDPPGRPALPRLDGPSIIAAAEAELRRLRSDHIDLLQLHWPDRYVPGFGRFQYRLDAAAAQPRLGLDKAPAAAASSDGGKGSSDGAGERGQQQEEGVPVSSFEEQVEAIGKLLQQGKIRAWGLSNETSWGVMRQCAAADAAGLPRPATLQNSYSLLHRQFEGDLAEVCAPHHLNLGLLPWSALAGGALSGKYLPYGTLPPGCRLTLFPERYARFNTPRVAAAVAEYVRVAAEAGLTPAQLGYAWCRSRWFIPSVIIGATSAQQLLENLGAFQSQPALQPETIAAIEQIHLRHRNPTLWD